MKEQRQQAKDETNIAERKEKKPCISGHNETPDAAKNRTRGEKRRAKRRRRVEEWDELALEGRHVGFCYLACAIFL